MNGKGNLSFKCQFLKIRCTKGNENAVLILSTPDPILNINITANFSKSCEAKRYEELLQHYSS